MPRRRIQRAGNFLDKCGITVDQKSSALKLVINTNHRGNRKVLNGLATKHGLGPGNHVETLIKALGGDLIIQRRKATIEIRPEEET